MCNNLTYISGMFNLKLKIMYDLMWNVVCEFYAKWLRPKIQKKVEDSTTKIDDFFLEQLDDLFDYGE